MRPAISPVPDIQNQKNFASIREALGGNLSFDNMNIRVISGTTANTPDTQYLAIHSMTPRPIGWFPLVGDVYVQEISNKYIDVRSTKPGVNFKIVILGGSPVTGESLVSIGDDSYRPTPSDIFADSSSTGQVFYGEFDYLIGNGILGGIYHVISDSDYFYFTNRTTSESNYVMRCSRSTGKIDRLALGVAQLGPLYNDGSNLWVIQQNCANLYKVSVSSFSLTSTIAIAATATAFGGVTDASDLYVDGANAYILGNDGVTSGGGGTRINKNLTATGGEVGYCAPTVATYGKHAHQLATDGTYLYFYTTGPNATPNINAHRLALAFTGTVTVSGGSLLAVTYSITGANYWVQNSIFYGSSSYSLSTLRGEVLSSANSYCAQIVEYNYNSGGFSFYPIFLPSTQTQIWGTNGSMGLEMKQIGQYIFILAIQNSSIQALNIFDSVTKQLVTYLYPIVNGTISGDLFTSNRMLIITPENGVVLANMGVTATPTNFSNVQFYELRF